MHYRYWFQPWHIYLSKLQDMQIFGLSGGIGSGKTSVANYLRENGIAVVDADQLAREIVAPGQPVLAQLVAAFGSEILQPNGELARQTLAKVAFSSPEQTARLNSITHPAIAAQAQQRFAALAAAGESCAVYDMPLLLETGQHRQLDGVIMVLADPEVRLQRLVAQRGLSAADARARISAQATEEQRREVADLVIENSGSRQELQAQLPAVVEWIRSRAGLDQS